MWQESVVRILSYEYSLSFIGYSKLRRSTPHTPYYVDHDAKHVVVRTLSQSINGLEYRTSGPEDICTSVGT